MLSSLKVKNYALISDVEMNFSAGMNIITGETGAGKSILIGALGLVLGNRADISALRNKESKCVIEAIFDVRDYDVKHVFESNDLDFESHTIFRREITSNGKSRSFINDTPTTLKVLNEIGARLVEVHSQQDNLQLFRSDIQYYSLDSLASCLDGQRDYLVALKSYKKDKAELGILKGKEIELAKEADFNQFLFDELTKAKLDNFNESELETEQELLENAEELIRTFNSADQLLSLGDFAVISQLQDVRTLFERQKTALTGALSERVKSVLLELQDIASEVEKTVEEVEVNPERLEEVNERMGVVFNLKSKHRVSDTLDLIRLKNELGEKLEITQNLSGDMVILEQRIDKQRDRLFVMAKKLSTKRIKQATRIEEEIDVLLGQLGMQHSKIKYELKVVDELNDFGCNELIIKLSSDKGKTFVELKKSASGGELARISLILKSILAKYVKMPSSIFDEIDTGVSGEIARKVGGMMKEMSGSQQVIVITHLPQIASLGETHLFVYKSENKNSVETEVRILKGDERINEIAKMISGDNLTEHAVEQSKELLKG